MEDLQAWIPQLHNYSGRVQGIKANEELNDKGKAARITREKETMLQALAKLDNKLEKFKTTARELDGAMINKIAVARDGNNPMQRDPLRILIDLMQQQETRSLWRDSQVKAEKDHQRTWRALSGQVFR